MLKRLLLFVLVLMSHVCYSQNFSNKGKDFWVSYSNHSEMFDLLDTLTPGRRETMQLYLTSDMNTSGLVEIPGLNVQIPFTVVADKITTVDIPGDAALLDEGRYNLGIHVTAVDPIVVYSFVFFRAVSGATLCLPVTTLGKEYFSINYTQVSNLEDSYSFFDVIATDSGITSVEIIPAQKTKGGRAAGVPFVVDLKQGEVYQVLGAKTSSVITLGDTAYLGSDLTGSKIRSISTAANKCKKIAVFCGSGKISIGCPRTGSSDNLYQQIYPVNTWGKAYMTVPSFNRANLEGYINYYRIFKSTPSTTVRLNGVPLSDADFVNGQYYDFDNGVPNFIEADKPIIVAQYFPTTGCVGGEYNVNGDPEMIYLNPVEQTLSSVTLNSISPKNLNSNINYHYINVVLKNSPGVINSFKIDGKQAGDFVVHPNNPGYAYAQIPVKPFGHKLTCDSGFNAIAYGYGHLESYGYSAGTNLKDFYQFVSIQNEYATENFPSGCKGSPFRFSINLPYQPLRIQWRFKGLFKDTTLVAPQADSSWVINDRIIYRYQLKRTHLINKSGKYPITVVADNPTTDGCSGEQIIDYDLDIFDRHKAGFSSLVDKCLNQPVGFTDTSHTQGRQTIRWLWNFGDGMGSDTASPEHRYMKSGSYTVSLATITDIGCISDTATARIVLPAGPIASFTAPLNACQNIPVAFTAGTEGVSRWSWDFGDGGSSGQANIAHAYSTTGTYNVKLRVEDGAGCGDTLVLPITVGSLPLADFVLPQSCAIDAPVTFTDASTIDDNTESLFAYSWSFGDGRATPGNPDTSADKDASHRYGAPGTYNVTLRVTSKDGCTADTTRQYNHYSLAPAAAFDIRYPTSLCGDTDITVIDRSTIGFGKIEKVEVYWDNANDTTAKTVDLSPEPGRLYSYKYPPSSSQSARQFVILFKVYSGTECTQSVTKTITVLPALQLQFDPLAAVCEKSEPFVITGARELMGEAGSGVFSGPGVTPEGLFDPGAAKPGLHTLRYTYSVTNGCSSYVEQTISVLAPPFADAGPDIMVDKGGSVTIQARGAENSTYSWSPAEFIDNHAVLNPRVSPAEDMTYYLKIVSPDGCFSTDSVVVRIQKDIKVPNAFSPNGDGINDTWTIPNLSFYVDASLDVFNRYGQKVFHSTGYGKEWDGRFKGAGLPLGTYYYIINFKDGRRPVNGSVTIIR